MGWEPTITYCYDDTGRLVSSVAEVEWDDEQRDAMLSLEEYRRTEVCSKCGGPKRVCQDPLAENAFDGGDPVRCHVTTAVLRKQKAHSDSGTVEFPEALTWPIRVRG